MLKRTIEEIQANASIWWPQSIKDAAAASIDLPRLISTQSEFLGILLLSKKAPLKIFDIIKASEFPANLFLKHLTILTDFGGEPIKRLGKFFKSIFPKDADGYYFDFIWNRDTYTYRFTTLPIKGLSNTKLSIDGPGQRNDKPLDTLTKDMIAVLLFAGSSNISHLAGLDVCNIGVLLGDEERLMQHVKQKYLYVSRITGGAIANSYGQTAQKQILKFLKSKLDENHSVRSNAKIILSDYEKKGGMPFDIVIDTEGARKIGIEISFQVTTNSTIERKAGQAADRQSLMHKDGHQIAYVLDGAGNFERSTAFNTIIEHSDCTVAYSPKELEILVIWIKTIL